MDMPVLCSGKPYLYRSIAICYKKNPYRDNPEQIVVSASFTRQAEI